MKIKLSFINNFYFFTFENKSESYASELLKDFSSCNPNYSATISFTLCDSLLCFNIVEKVTYYKPNRNYLSTDHIYLRYSLDPNDLKLATLTTATLDTSNTTNTTTNTNTTNIYW